MQDVPQKPSRKNPRNTIYEQLKKDPQASPCPFRLCKVLAEAFQTQLRTPEPGRLTARVFMTLIKGRAAFNDCII